MVPNLFGLGIWTSLQNSKMLMRLRAGREGAETFVPKVSVLGLWFPRLSVEVALSV